MLINFEKNNLFSILHSCSKNIVKSQTSWYNIKSYLEMWNGFGFWNQFLTK